MYSLLKQNLQNTLGVTDWDSFNFFILPGDDPKGFINLSAVNRASQASTTKTWDIAIAISDLTRSGLLSQIDDLTDLVIDSYSKAASCIDGGHLVKFGESGIVIEPVQSYPQQDVSSNLSGFFTAMGFQLIIYS